MSSLSTLAHASHGNFCSIIPPHLQTPEMRSKLASLKQNRHGLKNISAIERGIKIGKPADSIVKIFDAKHLQKLPGTKIRDPLTGGNSAEFRAYNGAMKTYQFFLKEFGRNSLDNKGMQLCSTVRYDASFDNAFFDGTRMVYGEGSGPFGDFTTDLDVITHEFTHGVTQYGPNLVYEGEPGALNEHVSDAFGSMIKQYDQNVASRDADWLIGENVLRGDKYALRNMERPGTGYVNHPQLGTDPQPASWADAVDPANADPHINSGIANRAFCLACKEVGGNSWDKIGKVWYALQSKIGPNETFNGFATKSIEVAKDMFPGSSSHGDISAEAKAILTAWRTVNVLS